MTYGKEGAEEDWKRFQKQWEDVVQGSLEFKEEFKEYWQEFNDEYWSEYGDRFKAW